MFTTSQKIADARVNGRIFLALALAGAVLGVVVWHQLLPSRLPEIPIWRVLWILATDTHQREFWQQQYNVITYLFVSIAGGALGLPLLVAAIRKSRNGNA